MREGAHALKYDGAYDRFDHMGGAQVTVTHFKDGAGTSVLLWRIAYPKPRLHT